MGALAGALTLPMPAGAQGQAAAGAPMAELDPTIVTASRSQQKLADALPHTTVITRQDIARAQVPDVASLLRREAGIEIAQTGGPGSNASLFMRGAGSNQTLILIDGVRAGSATAGVTQIGQLMADQIDRIEIVRGNVSALYGSAAIGGVVQIFTRDGREQALRPHAEIESGARASRRVQAGLGGQLGTRGDTAFSLSVSAFRTDGFSSIDPRQAPRANPNDNAYANQSASAQWRHRFSDDWQAGLTGFQTWGVTHYDNAFGARADDDYVAHNRIRAMSAWVEGRLSPDWITRLTLAQGDDDNRGALNGRPQIPGRFETRNRQLTWQNDWAFLPAQRISAGFERLSQKLDTDAYAAPVRHANAGFLGYDGGLGPHQLQLNLRRDQYADSGGVTSHYAGYGLTLNAQWKLVVSLSNAHRAPALNDLYYPGFGNPRLLPEKARSAEGGVEHHGALGRMRVMAFETRYDNLITSAYDPVSNRFMAANVNRARVRGLEMSYRSTLDGVDLRASLTLQNPRDHSTGQRLLRRAQHFGSVSADKTFGKISAGIEWSLAGDRRDIPERLGGYGQVSLSGRYRIMRDWTLSARLENLLNKCYQTVYRYNTPPRGAFVTLSWQPRAS